MSAIPSVLLSSEFANWDTQSWWLMMAVVMEHQKSHVGLAQLS
jgi:hypothetical protein